MSRNVRFNIMFVLLVGGVLTIALVILKKYEIRLFPFWSDSAHQLPGEQFIRTTMLNDNGTLKTTLKPEIYGDDYAIGDESLSESLGLWLLYAVENADAELFAQNVEVLEKYFWIDGFIPWKLNIDATRAPVNALIDDLRIAEALYRAAQQWGEARYKYLADQIAASLLEKQLVDELFTDFYDERTKRASETLTLSYLNVFVMKEMARNGSIPYELYENHVQYLASIPLRNGFFPYSYNLLENTYLYHDELNLIDQLYIVYHRQQVGIPSDEVWSFVKESFARDGKLVGRYNTSTKMGAAKYESPAIYGLAILCALEMNEYRFARRLLKRMTELQTLNPRSEYYGGYVFSGNTHIFDNLIPLLAERKALNAKVLP